MYKVSGVVSGGLSDLMVKASQWSVSGEQLETRAGRRRAIHDELRQLHRLEARRHQPTSQIAVNVAAQNKLLQVAEEQRNRLVRYDTIRCDIIACAQKLTIMASLV